MRKIIDKIPLLLLCCLLSGEESNMISVTASFLVAVSVSSLCQYCGKGCISFCAEIIYIVACFAVPELLYYAPLVIYDVLYEKRHYICGTAAIVLIYSAAYKSIDSISYIIVCTMIAVVLWLKTSSLETVEQKYITSRDTSAEVNILLSEKNKNLRKQQDNEIHLATLKERNRIAREIHDNVGHLLSRSILQVGALQITAADGFQKESLLSLSETLNEAMSSVRSSVHNLHDESVDLKQSVSEAVKPLSEKGIDVHLDLSISEKINNNIKYCFISIVKEGISNILKHSTADSVSVIIREHPAFYQLMIEDNGKCTGDINSGGIGLSNMRDRIDELGGIITVNYGENGFRIFISVKK